ncbi:hypothetical protein OEA41_002475 [Lepraria neglecta]|uniref:Uncharacterized protein n=1 Tax=Lepraria neglecta TaxID=209136 RepID=A0AAD9ZEU9_9LECA|nr:hypothetical protein OEA41_002475 [Lepraria neglecta]
MEGRLLYLERFCNEYDETADKSWRITNNLESLGSPVELEGSSSLREQEDTLIQEVSHILADERFEAEDVWTARRLHAVEDIEGMKDTEGTGMQIVIYHREVPRDLGA